MSDTTEDAAQLRARAVKARANAIDALRRATKEAYLAAEVASVISDRALENAILGASREIREAITAAEKVDDSAVFRHTLNALCGLHDAWQTYSDEVDRKLDQAAARIAAAKVVLTPAEAEQIVSLRVVFRKITERINEAEQFVLAGFDAYNDSHQCLWEIADRKNSSAALLAKIMNRAGS